MWKHLIEVDRGHLRLAVWIATSLLLIFGLYSDQVTTLVSGLNVLLLSTLGTVLPAYPFLALLLFLTALRWKDFHRVLLTERALASSPSTRLAGILLVISPMIFWRIAFGSGAPSVYFAMELSAVTFVLVAYGTLLALNPTMSKIMLPYALLYVVGLVSPLVMLDVFGDSLVALSSYLTSGIVGVLGIHVLWQGSAFQLVSVTGEQISAVITAPCSAAYSISIYLALLGLMYLDMRKSVNLTAKLGVVGVIALPLINSARIATTIWFGFQGGSAAFWGIHDWLGYATFFGFYLAVLVTYSRAGGPSRVLSQSALIP